MSCRGGLSAKADATISTVVPAPEVPHSAPFQSTISLTPRSMHASHPTPHLFPAYAASIRRLLTSPDAITRFGHGEGPHSHHAHDRKWPHGRDICYGKGRHGLGEAALGGAGDGSCGHPGLGGAWQGTHRRGKRKCKWWGRAVHSRRWVSVGPKLDGATQAHE
ncbi:hypothetical protein VitviT2T_008918 [Vitis vinifera]|uniref:Uncharacterized protein n=1 Tax=Vitis vinifera TaxID=29760 RepID=A0ABY9C462_VITVI|nr:hypothetical protein VitviT2T_008918 [Vitis vinifera]